MGGLESLTPIPGLEIGEKGILEPSFTQAGIRATFTTEQEKAFDEFQELCRNSGVFEDALGLEDRDSRDGIHDEATLFRFFTARRCDAAKAHEQFKEAFEIRKSNELVELYRSIDIDLYEETRLQYPFWTGRRDKRGNPVCILELSPAGLNAATVAAHKLSSNAAAASTPQPKSPDAASLHVRRAYAIFDHLTRFVMPLCSAVPDRPNPETPITKQIIIIDATEMGGLLRGWKLKEFALEFDKVLNRSYPEILEKIIIVGTPSYFSYIWNWAKPLLDPVTVPKVQLPSPEELLPLLETYMHIEDIPQKYGGELKTEGGKMPVLDSKISDVLEWAPASEKSLPPGPLHWVNGPDGSKTAVAVGVVNGEKRCVEFASIR